MKWKVDFASCHVFKKGVTQYMRGPSRSQLACRTIWQKICWAPYSNLRLGYEEAHAVGFLPIGGTCFFNGILMESSIYLMSVSPQLVVVTFVIVLLTLPYQSSSAYLLNQTGGSFPISVYQQSTFSYNFVVPTVSVSYYGPSSSVGKCNVMGYWHTLNGGAADAGVLQSTKNRDQLICTDKCTFLTCGYNPTKNVTYTIAGKKYIGLTIRPDSKSRTPLTDFGASDGLLSAADYLNFPDLQMLPALAGAVVPIYNIPELGKSNITTPLILSRSSLVNIFMGNITVSDCSDSSFRRLSTGN